MLSFRGRLAVAIICTYVSHWLTIIEKFPNFLESFPNSELLNLAELFLRIELVILVENGRVVVCPSRVACSK